MVDRRILIRKGDEKRRIWSVAFAACLSSATSAQAETYILSLTGQINGLTASNRQLMPAPVVETELHAGDLVSASVTFTTRLSPDDHDGIYFPGGKDFRLTVGTYSWTSLSGMDVFTKVTLVNDGGSVAKYDSFDLASLIYGAAPFAGWDGSPGIIFDYSFYDYTAQMLSSRDLLALPALGVFPAGGGSASVSFNGIGTNVGRIVNASVGNLRASLTVVPEPDAWMLMLAGFAAIGGSMRYGRRRRRPSMGRPASS